VRELLFTQLVVAVVLEARLALLELTAEVWVGLMVAVVALVYLVEQTQEVELGRCVSSGPVTLVHSHQLALAIFN
jgi:hypothetical protein